MTIGRMFLPALLRIPTPGNLRLRRAIGRLDRIVYRLIAERRASRAPERDLLSMLLDARDGQGRSMMDRQLRDEILTLLVAGHETTALALTWTSYLLTRHPEVQVRLRAERTKVLGDRPPSVEDVPRLSYTRTLLLESMRLYPPAWSIGREAVEPCEIGGYAIPAGAQIWISQWILHRDPRFFSEAEQFRPERWESGLLDRLPRFVYFPFGGGPRHCIGESFAMMEGILLLAALARRFTLVREPSPPVGLWPVMTLRPKDPIWITLRAR
jgi:cytochrome P450